MHTRLQQDERAYRPSGENGGDQGQAVGSNFRRIRPLNQLNEDGGASDAVNVSRVVACRMSADLLKEGWLDCARLTEEDTTEGGEGADEVGFPGDGRLDAIDIGRGGERVAGHGCGGLGAQVLGLVCERTRRGRMEEERMDREDEQGMREETRRETEAEAGTKLKRKQRAAVWLCGEAASAVAQVGARPCADAHLKLREGTSQAGAREPLRDRPCDAAIGPPVCSQ